MRKILLFLLIFLSVISILINFGYQPLIHVLGLTPRAGLRITTTKQAKVLFNNKEAGNTPYQDENLKEGEYLIALQEIDASSSGKVLWQGYAKLFGGTLTVINRELGSNPSISSGEVITLESGRGVTVVSNPPEAEVNIDGKNVGRAPITIPGMSAGEHQFILGHDSYLKRSIKATSVEGYNLTLSVDLAISEPDLTKLPTIPVTETQEVIVKGTPTGFLRVRATPSLNGAEVAKVNPGDSLILLEEIANWDRVRLTDGKEGYVASSYVDKKKPVSSPASSVSP